MRTFLGYVTVAAVLTGFYLGVMFIPLELDHLAVKDIVNTTFHRFNTLGSEGVHDEIVMNLRRVDWATHEAEDEYGVKQTVKGLDIADEQVEVEYDERTKKLRVRVNYDRIVRLRPSKEIHVSHFVFERIDVPPNVL